MRHVTKRLRMALVMACFVPQLVLAGTNGKITGLVKDKETGDALPGVNIILEGTTMGAATNASGEFLIINVPAGVYTVSTSMIGYSKVTKQNVRVLPDFTTRLDFDLTAADLGGQEVVIVAERPLIQKDQTMTMSVTSSDEIKNLPVRGFASVATLGVGITLGNLRSVDGGFGNVNVRGGRPSETGVIVDGFLQNNLLTGLSTAQLPSGAVEELVVITGGFDAEFGRNQSGIIQVTSKAGGQKYSGFVEYVNDRPMFALNKDHYFGYDVYSAGIGGPLIPGNNNIRFFISGEAKDITDAEPSVTGFPVFSLSDDGIRGEAGELDTVIFETTSDPTKVKFDKGARPKNRSGFGVNSDRAIALQSKITYQLNPSLRFDLSGNYTQAWRRAFTNDQTVSLDLVQRRPLENVNVGLIATYTLNERSFFDVGANYFKNRRRIMHDLYGFDPNTYIGKGTGTTGFSTYYNDNIFNDIASSDRNFREDRDQYWAFKANYVNQIDKHNQLKAGFDYFRHEIRFLNILDNDNPSTGSNDNVGFIVDENNNLKENNKDDLDNRLIGPANPVSFATYLQDKLEYEGLVVRAGLRYDLFDPGIKRIRNLADPTGQGDPNQALVFNDLNGNNLFDRATEVATGGYTDVNGNGNFDTGTDRLFAGSLGSEDYKSSKIQHKFSPRFSVSFPVSERTQFRMSYGKFFQQPDLQNLYVSPDFLSRQSIAPPFATVIGNTNLEPEQSTQYEVGLRRAISDHFAIDLSAYYKDIQGLTQANLVNSIPNGLIMTTNDDEGVIQGLTLAMDLRRVGKFQGRVAYTFQSARGTGSGNATNFRSAWLGFQSVKTSAPLNFDQTHTINANLDIRNAKGDGPVIGGTHILEEAGLNFQLNAASGLPYTQFTVVPFQESGVPQGRTIGRRNSQRQPWTVRIDLKADKTIHFNERFNTNIYIQVLNLLNRKNVLAVFPATGRADDNGFLSTAAGQALTDRQKQQYDVIFHEGLFYDTPMQARLGILFNF